MMVHKLSLEAGELGRTEQFAKKVNRNLHRESWSCNEVQITDASFQIIPMETKIAEATTFEIDDKYLEV